jgi:Bifunctional DNA primase/polymerase, N-terminal
MSREAAAAAAYAARRWRIFPVGRDKQPLTAHGFRDATDDGGQVRRWWAEHPDAGIGWTVPPGLVVIDIDPRHDGEDSIADLEREHGKLPATAASRTGSGGAHLIYRIPAGVELRQLVGMRPGLDTRLGGRGYIILPPTLHASGRRYEWRDRLPPAEAPAWLVELVRVRPAVPVPYLAPVVPIDTGRRARYAAAVLCGEAEAVATTGEGARNARLNKAWWRCSQFRDVLDRDAVARELTAAATAAGLPPREIERVLR